MSTVAVARKNGYVAIAADTQTSFGTRKVSATYNRHAGKISRIGSSFFGLTGWAVNQQVLEHVFRSVPAPPAFANTLEIFEVFLALQTRLKAEYFMVPRDGERDAYESNHLNVLIANPHGLFGLYSMRDVFEYDRFWASGSGSEYALGAMHSIYGAAADAVTIAEAGVQAGVEFDDASGGPIESHVIRLATSAAVDEMQLLLKAQGDAVVPA